LVTERKLMKIENENDVKRKSRRNLLPRSVNVKRH